MARCTGDDFERLSFHDCHIWGLQFRAGDAERGEWVSELELDIDYILEWRHTQDGYSFLVVPVSLRFHQVFGLRIAIDWQSPSAGMGPFSLAGIERRVEERERYSATLWNLPINWPSGAIEFEATGFTQASQGPEVVSTSQCLGKGRRGDA